MHDQSPSVTNVHPKDTQPAGLPEQHGLNSPDVGQDRSKGACAHVGVQPPLACERYKNPHTIGLCLLMTSQ